MPRLLTFIIVCLLMACVKSHRESFDAQNVIIYKADGSRQCEPGSGTSVSAMAQALTNAGIAVFSSRGDHDCLFRPALCGTATGTINIYEIPANRLSQAQDLGFIPYSHLQARCESR